MKDILCTFVVKYDTLVDKTSHLVYYEIVYLN